jgi:tetratricopeptide (TPR) repeat protein
MIRLRRWLGVLLLCCCLWLGGAIEVLAAPAPVANYSDDQLAKGDTLRTEAFLATNRRDFALAETYWSQLIELFPENPALWSNRGNSRVSQGKLPEAIADYDRSISLAPEISDAYLNRGAAREGLGEWTAAIADYQKVLALEPDDAMAYNNLGNAHAGQGDWQGAKAYFYRASELDSSFAFAQANYALALYQLDETPAAIKKLKDLARKYRDFPDVRAALAAALWQNGQRGEAESHWVAAIGLDARYRDLDWVQNNRRWPPLLVAALDSFLHLR